MSLKPRDYQVEATNFALKHKYSYIAADMGTGKTLISINWAEQLPCGVLVLAPLRGVHITWPDEIEKWTGKKDYRILHGEDKDYSLKRKAKYYLVNYDGLKWLFTSLVKKFKAGETLPFRAMIIDEGSMLKSHSSKRFKYMKQMKDLCRFGIIILSGTPAPNALLNLWSQYFILDGGASLGKTYTGFRDKYFYNPPNRAYTYLIKGPEEADAIHRMVAPITFRLDGSEYLDLPERLDNVIPVRLSSAQLAQYRELKKKLILDLGDVKAIAKFAASLSMKLRQFTQGAVYVDEVGTYKVVHEEKLKTLSNLVEELNGKPLLCAIQFKFEYFMIREVFKDVPIVAGPIKGEKLVDGNKLIRQWNAGDLPLLLCHPASLSHSVNMQTGGHNLLWYAPTWSLEQYLQLNKRLHRSGQQNTVIIHHLVAENTIDSMIMKALTTKQNTQQALLDYLEAWDHE